MKPVLIGVGVVIAVLVVIPLAGKLMPGSPKSGGTSAPSAGEAMVAPSYSGRLLDTKGAPLPNAMV